MKFENNTNKPSQTDWERLARMNDDEIDYSEIPPFTDEFFRKTTLFAPSQRAVIIDLDADGKLTERSLCHADQRTGTPLDNFRNFAMDNRVFQGKKD